MAYLEINNVSKSFKDGKNVTHVLKNINLKIEEGDFVSIVGFSGSGKSTLIKLIAGLLKPDSGEILLNGEKIKEPGPDRGVVFQNYSLLPWLNVLNNVNMAVRQVFSKKSKKEQENQSKKFIDMVNLSPALNKKPSELSGGMRQRVSVARALAISPKIMLLDEPLAALDALTRGDLQKEIANIWQKEKKTIILITNDIDEGILLSDRIIPLTKGPEATFGPEFNINIPRPRDLTSLNQNKDYKDLKSKVTKFLLSLNEGDSNSKTNQFVLPDLKPKVI